MGGKKLFNRSKKDIDGPIRPQQNSRKGGGKLIQEGSEGSKVVVKLRRDHPDPLIVN